VRADRVAVAPPRRRRGDPDNGGSRRARRALVGDGSERDGGVVVSRSPHPLDPLCAAIAERRAATTGALRTALGYPELADAMAVPSPIATTAAPEREPTTIYIPDEVRVRASGARLGDRFAAADQALAALRALGRDPRATRAAVEAAVSELARALAQTRRNVRAAAAELGALESDGRAAVAAMFQARMRGRIG